MFNRPRCSQVATGGSTTFRDTDTALSISQVAFLPRVFQLPLPSREVSDRDGGARHSAVDLTKPSPNPMLSTASWQHVRLEWVKQRYRLSEIILFNN